jgi:hypothetical protein
VQVLQALIEPAPWTAELARHGMWTFRDLSEVHLELDIEVEVLWRELPPVVHETEHRQQSVGAANAGACLEVRDEGAVQQRVARRDVQSNKVQCPVPVNASEIVQDPQAVPAGGLGLVWLNGLWESTMAPTESADSRRRLLLSLSLVSGRWATRAEHGAQLVVRVNRKGTRRSTRSRVIPPGSVSMLSRWGRCSR